MQTREERLKNCTTLEKLVYEIVAYAPATASVTTAYVSDRLSKPSSELEPVITSLINRHLLRRKGNELDVHAF